MRPILSVLAADLYQNIGPFQEMYVHDNHDRRRLYPQVQSARPQRTQKNVAVIRSRRSTAKTSLVNPMLAQAGLVNVKFGEGGFTIDSHEWQPLEREKGVTILYQDHWHFLSPKEILSRRNGENPDPNTRLRLNNHR